MSADRPPCDDERTGTDPRPMSQNPDGSWSHAEPLKATWETDGRLMRWLASWVPWLRWRSRDGGKTEGLG